MKKKKPQSDVNVTAFEILQAATGPPITISVKKSNKKKTPRIKTGGLPSSDSISHDGKIYSKNPAAVALGRLGGLKGGKARAEKLSQKKRVQIARDAALARWRFNK